MSALVTALYTSQKIQALRIAQWVVSYCNVSSLWSDIVYDDPTAMWCDVISPLHIKQSSFWLRIDRIAGLNGFGENGLGYVIVLWKPYFFPLRSPHFMEGEKPRGWGRGGGVGGSEGMVLMVQRCSLAEEARKGALCWLVHVHACARLGWFLEGVRHSLGWDVWGSSLPARNAQQMFSTPPPHINL